MASHRSYITYSDPLDDAAHEWRRMRIWIENGQVVRFVVQYETTINGRRMPVVRYDTAHGFAHRDEMFRNRLSVKTLLPATLTLDQALQVAEADIRHNWRTYRQQFEGTS